VDAVLCATPAKEKSLPPYLYLNELDGAQFPELERAPGVYAIEAALLKPGLDSRIPVVGASAMALLVSYRLLAREIPAGAAWQLEIKRMQANGTLRQAIVVLIRPPPKRNNIERATPISPDQLPEGTVDGAVFWVDLGSLFDAQSLRPGDTLTLRYGKAATSLVIPARSRPSRQ
jgi:hypothetical protein